MAGLYTQNDYEWHFDHIISYERFFYITHFNTLVVKKLATIDFLLFYVYRRDTVFDVYGCNTVSESVERRFIRRQ